MVHDHHKDDEIVCNKWWSDLAFIGPGIVLKKLPSK